MIKVLIIANDESTIYNFRREVLAAFVRQGFKLILCYPLDVHAQELEEIGCELINITVNRHGKNVVQDFRLLLRCKQLIRNYNPDIVLTYTVKPNIYGSIACQWNKKPYVNNVTGLGSILQTQGILAKLMLGLQWYAYRKSACVFFQNEDNYKSMRKYRVISANTPVQILPGSGVNLELQSYEPFPRNDGIIRFIMVSRVRIDKGYREFLGAAEKIKEKYFETEFHIVGWYEEEILQKDIEEFEKHGVVIYHGQQTQEEVHQLIKKCNCLVHPSYHEGMANVLLEAAATGRPVIASRIPGCLEAFEEGSTGYGCYAKDTKSLFEAMERLVLTPYEKQIEMGRLGRKKMEKQFDRKIVSEQYIQQILKVVGVR